jgi:excisionase family DNA binding protein
MIDTKSNGTARPNGASRSDDAGPAEIEAVRAIAQILRPLGREAAVRVLRSAAALFEQPALDEPGPGKSGPEPTRSVHPMSHRRLADCGPLDALTAGNVAEIVRVAPRTVSKWIDSGLLRGYRLPGSQDRRVLAKDLKAFMEARGMPVELGQ